MATSVAAPLERQLAVIPGVADLSSSNSAGSTQITVEFDLSRDITAAAQDVQAAINAAAGRLPKEMPDPPTYEKVNPAEATILSLAVTSDTLPIADVDDYADNYVAQRISRIAGVGLVDLNGEQKPAVRVQINPTAVAAMGLSLEDVRAAIAAGTLSAPKGALNGPARTVTLNTNDQAFDPHVYDDMVIAYRNGAPVRISDIGEVTSGVEDITRGAWVGPKRTVIVDLHKQQGSNVNQTVERVKALLPDIVRSLPPSVHVRVVADRTQTINAAVGEVQATLLLTIGVVFVVVLAFLRRIWPTVIAGVVVPLSLIGTFAAMLVLHYSLNNISLMGLTIAVGFVIDDAIVMVENIVARLERGEAPLEAAPGRGQTDRLHGGLDLDLPDRRVHSGAVPGRRGRAIVPGIRSHGLHRRGHIGADLPDPDARPLRFAALAARDRENQGRAAGRGSGAAGGPGRSGL